MKIIFLDIDGVLNSEKYEADRAENRDGDYIDLSRVGLLADLVNATDAKIVLISSWRVDWNQDSKLCGNDGTYINQCLAKYGLFIMDKTPYFSFFTQRKKEILTWISQHCSQVESFVIFDDTDHGWGELSDRVILTNPRGYGLEEVHIQKALELLQVKFDSTELA